MDIVKIQSIYHAILELYHFGNQRFEYSKFVIVMDVIDVLLKNFFM